MRKQIRNRKLNANAIAVLLFVSIALLFGACANRLGPGGGPYDDTPPRLLSSNPKNGERNVKKKKIVLNFDEYITIKDVSKKVIISPPQKEMARIQAVGKRVEVLLNDTLIPNTTYSIDFTDAIVDNNESNALENFSIAFATGPDLDTMQMAGTVLDARNLEPIQGVLVGVHADSSLALFRDTSFLRMSRTSDRARFVIRNMKQGSYRIYALKDNDANYRYNNPLEGIAFSDSMYTTSQRPAIRVDSIFKEVKGKRVLDSLQEVPYIEYLPNDIVLRYFVSDKLRNYLSDRKRPDSNRIELSFNNNIVDVSQIPRMVPLGETMNNSSKMILPDVYIPNNKVTFYLLNKIAIKADTFVVQYPSIDSLQHTILVKDTIALKYTLPKDPDKEKEKGKKKDKKEEEKTKDVTQVTDSIAPTDSIPAKDSIAPTEKKKDALWKLSAERKGDGGLEDSLIISSSFPIDVDSLSTHLRLFVMKDSTQVPVKIDTVVPFSGSYTKFLLKAPIHYKRAYQLMTDTTTVLEDLLNRPLSQALTFKFETKDKSEFSGFELNVNIDNAPAMIGEMLDGGDKVLKQVWVKDTKLIPFLDLKPGKYYFRVIIDENKNGRWDTGDLDLQRQPEPVFYLNKEFELLKNWTLKETFDPYAVPLNKQKPLKLIKNKPQEKKKRDRNKEREEEMRKRNRGGGFGDAMGGLRRGISQF